MGIASAIRAQARQAAWGTWGLANFTALGYARHAAAWPPGDVADMARALPGHTAIVTGGSAGIGRALAQGLAARQVAVHLLCRNAAAGAAAAREITAATGNARVWAHAVDVSQPREVRAWLAGAWRGRAEPQNATLLLSNAGPLLPRRQETADGLEETFATNVLGAYALTEGLLAEAAAAGGGGRVERVVTVCSGAAVLERLQATDLPQLPRWAPPLPYDGLHVGILAKVRSLLLFCCSDPGLTTLKDRPPRNSATPARDAQGSGPSWP
jgi:hypothetical protein